MIVIRKSPTADTLTCDFANVSKETLVKSSKQHIDDVAKGLNVFSKMLAFTGVLHDDDKLTGIDHFHEDFITGFKKTGWWDNHRKVSRHHLMQDDGIPEDVNLIDVLEMIVDCVMAGIARSGSVYPLVVKDALLQRAFQNTVELLKKNVQVME